MLEIRLLGQFAVRQAGRPVEIKAKPAQSLLAYLALNPDVPQRRDHLAGLLWPESAEEQARRNLRQTLWQLRRAFGSLGPALIHSDDFSVTIAAAAEAVWVDAAQVRAPIDTSAPATAWQEALEAYGGELLPGFYEDWVSLAREQLRAEYEQKFGRLLDILIAAQRWPEVRTWAERWIASGGVPEPAYQALMQAHAAQGERAAVAETYRRCVEALRRALDVPPSALTQALYERLSRDAHAPHIGTPSPQNLSRHNLPVQLSSFIGREYELHATRQQLAAARLLTVTGPGGMGKTRLALQLAAGLINDYSDGVWLIELARISDPQLLPQVVAEPFDVQEKPGQPLLRSLIEFLRDKTLLLLLDNCEHIIAACASAAESILTACPNVRILATSRELLDIPGESVFRIPPLATPDGMSSTRLAEVISYESVRLLIARAQAREPNFVLTEDSAAAVAQICQRLDGMPLAIELVAARIPSLSPEQIVASLDDRFRLLSHGSRTALPRHQTLRALIDWSWELLSANEQRTMRQLSVFKGSWSLGAAESVCNDPHVAEVLPRLVEKSLVRTEQQGTQTRFSFLETIHLYALDKLRAAGDWAEMRQRHAHYFVALAADAEPQLRAHDQLTWLARLDAELGNLRAALHWAHESAAHDAGLQLCSGLYRYWYLRGYWSEGRDWLRQVLAQAPADDAEAATPASMRRLALRVKALCAAGWLADEDGGEKAYYQEAVVLSRQIGDRWSEAFALRGAAAAESNWLNPELTEANLRQSLALFEILQDPWGMGLAHYNLGWRPSPSHTATEAKSHWQSALEYFRRSGDRWGLAVVVNALGYLARADGDYARANDMLHESLALFHALGDKAGVATSLTRLATIAARRGDFADAESLLSESLLNLRERGDNPGSIGTLTQLGLVYSFQGKWQQADARLHEAQELVRRFDAQPDWPQVLYALALNAYRQNQLDTARAGWQECLARSHAPHDEMHAALAELGLSMVALRLGDVTQAAERIDGALQRTRDGGELRTRAMALQQAAQVAWAESEVSDDLARKRARSRAKALLRESLALHTRYGGQYGVAQALECGAMWLNDPFDAIHWVAIATRLRQTMGAPRTDAEQAQIETHLASLRAQLGDEAFGRAWREGEETSHESPLAYTLQQLGSGTD